MSPSTDFTDFKSPGSPESEAQDPKSSKVQDSKVQDPKAQDSKTQDPKAQTISAQTISTILSRINKITFKGKVYNMYFTKDILREIEKEKIKMTIQELINAIKLTGKYMVVIERSPSSSVVMYKAEFQNRNIAIRIIESNESLEEVDATEDVSVRKRVSTDVSKRVSINNGIAVPTTKRVSINDTTVPVIKDVSNDDVVLGKIAVEPSSQQNVPVTGNTGSKNAPVTGNSKNCRDTVENYRDDSSEEETCAKTERFRTEYMMDKLNKQTMKEEMRAWEEAADRKESRGYEQESNSSDKESNSSDKGSNSSDKETRGYDSFSDSDDLMMNDKRPASDNLVNDKRSKIDVINDVKMNGKKTTKEEALFDIDDSDADSIDMIPKSQLKKPSKDNNKGNNKDKKSVEEMEYKLTNAFYMSYIIPLPSLSLAMCESNGRMFDYRTSPCHIVGHRHASLTKYLKCFSKVLDILTLRHLFLIRNNFQAIVTVRERMYPIKEASSMLLYNLEAIITTMFPVKCTILIVDLMDLLTRYFNFTSMEILMTLIASTPNLRITRNGDSLSVTVIPMDSAAYSVWGDMDKWLKNKEKERKYMNGLEIGEQEEKYWNVKSSEVFGIRGENLKKIFTIADLNVPKELQVISKEIEECNEIGPFWRFLRHSANFDDRRTFYTL